MCNQLDKWILENGLMLTFQKGSGPSDGCAEHNNVLRTLLEEHDNVHNTFLDLTDSYGSIPIKHILGIL